MRTSTFSLLVVFALPACAAHGATPAATATASVPREVSTSEALPQSPRETWAEADNSYVSQLGVSRGGRFDTERQIVVLRRAVELYTQFLERAGGRPELASAVKKSHERRGDAQATIIFLEQSLRDGATKH